MRDDGADDGLDFPLSFRNPDAASNIAVTIRPRRQPFPRTFAVSTCPSTTDLTATMAGLALLVAFVAGMVGHGVLRPLLEARGVTPWRVRDSLGSLPLVLVGSALVGGAASYVAAWSVTGCSAHGWPTVSLLSAATICGVLLIRLGLLALRKLV